MPGIVETTALELRQQAADRLLGRLGGLDDDEYFWEPAPGCWSVRPVDDGTFRCEWRHHADPPEPFTTIAARMWHLGASPWELPPLTRDLVIEMQFVRPYHPEGRDPLEACGSAAEAVSSLRRNLARWMDHYEAVSDDELHAPLGPVAHRYADDSYYGLLVHGVDEYVHHSAEVALLRDVYRVMPQVLR